MPTTVRIGRLMDGNGGNGKQERHFYYSWMTTVWFTILLRKRLSKSKMANEIELEIVHTKTIAMEITDTVADSACSFIDDIRLKNFHAKLWLYRVASFNNGPNLRIHFVLVCFEDWQRWQKIANVVHSWAIEITKSPIMYVQMCIEHLVTSISRPPGRIFPWTWPNEFRILRKRCIYLLDIRHG